MNQNKSRPFFEMLFTTVPFPQTVNVSCEDGRDVIVGEGRRLVSQHSFTILARGSKIHRAEEQAGLGSISPINTRVHTHTHVYTNTTLTCFDVSDFFSLDEKIWLCT